MREDNGGCGPLVLKAILMWFVFFLGVFVGHAKGSTMEAVQDKPVAAQVIRALVEAANACEVKPQPTADNVHESQKDERYSGIVHLAGIDMDAVLMLDKHDLLDSVPQQISLGVYKITAYCACQTCCGKSPDDPRYGITATGTRATQGRTIAADPKVLPYGTVVIIDGHEYIVEDCGGAIKGNEIDLFFDDHQEARQWGNKYMEVYTYERH